MTARKVFQLNGRLFLLVAAQIKMSSTFYFPHFCNEMN